MNIEAANNVNTIDKKKTDSSYKQETDNTTTFSEELKNVAKENDEQNVDKQPAVEQNTDSAVNQNEKSENKQNLETENKNQENEKKLLLKEDSSIDVKIQQEIKTKFNQKNTECAINGLENVVQQITDINSDDKRPNDNPFKLPENKQTKKLVNEENNLIDNNINIQESKEPIMPEMNANMNFNSDGQQFNEFINSQNKNNTLKFSAKDLAEEKKIMSTMEENIAIANKNIALAKSQQEPVENLKQNQEKTKTVINDEGIKKVDTKSNITVDTIVSYDTVIMDKSDVEFFADLVNGNIMNLSDVQKPEKSAAVSKTLADLLVKAMEDNKPVRIDFDNNISVIIKISRNGKISADFLPSSQVAEAYLKENIPLLRQRFDDNNIEYDELNQRERKQNNENDNRKKGRKDE